MWPLGGICWKMVYWESFHLRLYLVSDLVHDPDDKPEPQPAVNQISVENTGFRVKSADFI